MARPKKKGLDYFPFDTNWLDDRTVCRLLKREGDGAMTVVLRALSHIYAEEGYYVEVDSLFYEDIAAKCYSYNAEDVERILHLAIEYGIFDADMFCQKQILTSAYIQRQYLFGKRKRSVADLNPEYCLLSDETFEEGERTSRKTKARSKAAASDTAKAAQLRLYTSGNSTCGMGGEEVSATKIPQRKEKHSTEEHSIEEQRKEYTPSRSPEKTPGESLHTEWGREENLMMENRAGYTGIPVKGSGMPMSADAQAQALTCRLEPPQDGVRRNCSGLIDTLQMYGIPRAEQEEIVRRSNFGAIGHPVWMALVKLREGRGGIKMPGRFLLSMLDGSTDFRRL